MTTAFDYDVDELVLELARRPKIVFLSSPSNPVGKALSHSELKRLLDAVQPTTLFVLDFKLIDPGYLDGVNLLAHTLGSVLGCAAYIFQSPWSCRVACGLRHLVG